MTLSVASSSFAPNFKMKQDEYQKRTTPRTQKSNRTHMLRACFENGVKKNVHGAKRRKLTFCLMLEN